MVASTFQKAVIGLVASASLFGNALANPVGNEGDFRDRLLSCSPIALAAANIDDTKISFEQQYNHLTESYDAFDLEASSKEVYKKPMSLIEKLGEQFHLYTNPEEIFTTSASISFHPEGAGENATNVRIFVQNMNKSGTEYGKYFREFSMIELGLDSVQAFDQRIFERHSDQQVAYDWTQKASEAIEMTLATCMEMATHPERSNDSATHSPVAPTHIDPANRYYGSTTEPS